MNQAQPLHYINRAYLHQKTWAILDKTKDLQGKLATGRRIRQGHYFSILQLIELAYIEHQKTGVAHLVTNRGNLAHAFKCSERSAYTYVMDFASLGFIHIQHEANLLGQVHIIIQFTTAIIVERTDEQAMGQQHSDVVPPPSPLIGKVCHIHNPKGLNNFINNHNNSTINHARNVESGTREAITQPIFRPEVEQYSVPSSLSSDVSAHRTLTHHANLLWQQSFYNLWKTRSFPHDVQAECVQLIALALTNRATGYRQERKQQIAQFCQSPAYQMAQDKKRVKLLKRFQSNLPLDLKRPDRAAFRDLNRAITIQTENCEKKGYEAYYPTVYFSEYFDKAIGYALKEKRTFAKHKKANNLRRAHTVAKLKMMSYADHAAQNLQLGFGTAMRTLRENYKAFKQFLYNSPIEDKEIYLKRFLEQCSFIIQRKQPS